MPYITFGNCYRENELAKDNGERSSEQNHRQTEIERQMKYQQLLNAYDDKIIHGTRSLDQFYYHSLPDMKDRNKNQVVTRSFLGGKHGNGVTDNVECWPILTVDQLWLWVIDEGK